MIKSVKIEIGRREVEITIDEAKKLRDELNKLFAAEAAQPVPTLVFKPCDKPHSPFYPTYPAIPYWGDRHAVPYEVIPWTNPIWCTSASSSSIKQENQ